MVLASTVAEVAVELEVVALVLASLVSEWA